MDKTEWDALYLQHLNDDPDDVLKELGQSVHTPLGARPPSPRELIEAARRWLDGERSRICQALWAHPTTGDFLRGRRAYQLPELLLAVTDVVRTFLADPTCGWASIFCVRQGLLTICPEGSGDFGPVRAGGAKESGGTGPGGPALPAANSGG
jgi:hypothetical protein